MSSLPSITTMLGTLPMQARRDSLISGEDVERDESVGSGKQTTDSEYYKNKSAINKIASEPVKEDAKYCSTESDKKLIQVTQIFIPLTFI